MALFETSKITNDFNYDISLGNYDNKKLEFKFGRNTSIGSAEEVVWDAGGNYTFLSTAEYINVSSTSSSDANGDVGAWNVIINGLDENFNEQSETVVLDGTTPVQTQKQYLRLFRAFVIESGNTSVIGGANQGDISFISDTTTTLQAKILEHNGQTLMAIYTVPAGKTALITGGTFAIGQGKECVFKGKFRNCSTENCVFSDKYSVELFESAFFATFPTPLPVPEKTDIVITGQNGATTVTASASFALVLVDNK